MEVREGYKQTEVGIIPEDWNIEPLGELTTLMTNGFVGPVTRHYAENDDGVLYIQGYNVEENSFNFHGIKYVTEEFHRAHMKSCLRAGDLLTIQTGEVGLTTIVPDDLAGSNCHALIISRFDKKYTSPHYVSYYLNSKPGRARLRLIETGTTMKHLNVGDVLHFTIPLPPTLAEQKAIAEALSDADALIEAVEQLLTKKRQVKQGAMSELLTGKRRLAGFSGKGYKQTEIGNVPEDWEVVTVKDITASHKQGFYTKENYVDNGTYLVRITDLMNPVINYTDMPKLKVSKRDFDFYKIRKGDFLFARSGSIGRYGIVYENVDAVFGSFIIRFTFNLAKVINEYFGYVYETEIVWKQLLSITQGSSNININANNIKSLKIPLPSLPEQTAIAEILSDMDAEISALEEKLVKARQVKAGMMSELLTGKIRLV